MNTNWLLNSSTLWGALIASVSISTALLFLGPEGLSTLHKRRAELRDYRQTLEKKRIKNQALFEEVRRLANHDPELFEALARKQGYARPGETIYTFRERGERP